MSRDKKDISSSEGLLKRSKKHTGRVKWLRRFLPIAGLLAILSILLWSSFEIFFEKKIEGIPDKARDLVKYNKVMNPRLKSTDSKGNPYKIQAESAIQGDNTQVSFEKPCCEIVGSKGQQIKLKSDRGFLNQKEQKFVYDENVRLETNEGYTFETQKAVVDLQSQNVTGTDPVVGQGPAGNITSKNGFFLDKNSQELHFKGPTKLIVHPKSLPKKGAQ